MYGRMAMSVRVAPFRTLAVLAERRKKHQNFKTIIDMLRTVLMTYFLVPETPKRMDRVPQNLHEVERHVVWLDATGDFCEDALRFIRWLGYWGTGKRRQFSETMVRVLAFSDWFEEASPVRMGCFTPNVDAFISEKA